MSGTREDVLQRVLQSSRLPSLPAIAVEVLNLTQQDVDIQQIARTIQHDPALFRHSYVGQPAWTPSSSMPRVSFCWQSAHTQIAPASSVSSTRSRLPCARDWRHKDSPATRDVAPRGRIAHSACVPGSVTLRGVQQAPRCGGWSCTWGEPWTAL